MTVHDSTNVHGRSFTEVVKFTSSRGFELKKGYFLKHFFLDDYNLKVIKFFLKIFFGRELFIIQYDFILLQLISKTILRSAT